MTKLQIKALREGVRLIGSEIVPFPLSWEEDARNYEFERRKIMDERLKYTISIDKGLEWIKAVIEDGERYLK